MNSIQNASKTDNSHLPTLLIENPPEELESEYPENTDKVSANASSLSVSQRALLLRSRSTTSGRMHMSSLVESTSHLFCTLIILPNNRLKVIWDWFIVALVVWSSINIPFDVAFNPSRKQMFIPDLVDGLFGVDLILSFRQGYVDIDGFMVLEPKMIAKRYLKSWFIIDLLATLPLEHIMSVFTASTSQFQFRRMLKILRMLRLGKLAKKKSSGGGQAVASNALRIVQLLFMFLMVAHWVACVWFYLGDIQTTSTRWLEADGLAQDDCDCLSEQYTAALYWALCTMTTVGYGDITPNTTMERWYAILCILLGAIIYSSIFANVNILIQSFDSLGQRYRSQMEAMNELLRFFKVDRDLGMRVLKNVDSTWNLNGGFQLQEVMETIPWGLRVEVCMNLYERIVRQAPMFQDSHRSLIQEIVIRLKPIVALKGDWIFREGDVGHEMLFVGRGALEILAGANADVLLTLVSEGSFFGETALFFTPSRRTASVRAATYAELYRITKLDFEDILLDFPMERDQMMRVAAEARERNQQAKEQEVHEAHDRVSPLRLRESQQEEDSEINRSLTKNGSLGEVWDERRMASRGSRSEVRSGAQTSGASTSSREGEGGRERGKSAAPAPVKSTRSGPLPQVPAAGTHQALLQWITRRKDPASPKPASWGTAADSSEVAAPLRPEAELRALMEAAGSREKSSPEKREQATERLKLWQKKTRNLVVPLVSTSRPENLPSVSITDNAELMEKIKQSSLDRRTKKASKIFRTSLMKSVQASFKMKRQKPAVQNSQPLLAASVVLESKITEMDHRTEEMLHILKEIRDYQKQTKLGSSLITCECQQDTEFESDSSHT